MDTYLSQGQVTGAADRTGKVTFDNSGDKALMAQQAGVGNAILAGAKMFVDQMQTTDITKASNMYRDKMAELRSQLMQNKEETAMDNMAKYEEGRQKILGEIYKTGPRYVREGQGRVKFEDAIEKEWITQKDQMRGYVIGESEKYADTQTANQLFGYNQQISESYSNPIMLQANIDAGIESLSKRYKYYGQERIDAAVRQWKGQAYGNAITSALGKEDYDAAGSLLQGYGKWLDPKVRASLDKMITERKRNNDRLSSVNSLYASFGKDIEGAWNARKKTLGRDRSKDVASSAEGMLGKSLGGNTCALFVSNMITAGGGDTSMNSQLADGLYLNYENKGLTFTDRSQLRDGDIVFWRGTSSKYTDSEDKSAVNSNDRAYKGITHCGIVKNGKVIQSGTSGIKAIDVDAYDFVAGAHQALRGMDATELEQERQKFYNEYNGLLSRNRYQQNLVVENMANQLFAMYQDGQPHTQKEYDDIIVKAANGNFEIYQKLSPLASHFGKGGGYHDLSILEAYSLEQAIDTGSVSQEELKDLLIKMNVKPSTAMEYIHKNKAAAAKEDRVNWTEIQRAFKTIDGVKELDDRQMMGAVMAAKRYVAEFAKNPKTRGAIPATDDILRYMVDSLKTGSAGEAAGGYGQYSVSRMMGAGIYRIDRRADGKLDVYFFGTDKPFPIPITEEQLGERMKEIKAN